MPTGHDLELAARLLRKGRLVAFPTETVYGLGARADQPAAVRRIFEAKGRPADHPLIVHVASMDALRPWVREVPALAAELAEKFWPGPLTLVLRKSPALPREVTGGLDTVAIRVPNHPVALELLQAVGLPIAAPSANRFTQLSPTHSSHVEQDLGDLVDYILEGGETEVGIESTILDLTASTPTILRPGGLSQEALEAVLGPLGQLPNSGSPKVPGMHPLHYAPRAKVELVAAQNLGPRAAELREQGAKVGLLLHGAAAESFDSNEHPSKSVVRLKGDHTAVAHSLYAALRELDAQRVDVVLTTLPEARGLGVAIADRLSKAAGRRS